MTTDHVRGLGAVLAPYSFVVSAARTAALQEQTEHAQALRHELNSKASQLSALQLQEERYSDHLRECSFREGELEQQRRRAPHTFSLFKGVFYVLLAGVLSFTDIPILGQVIARFLGVPWKDPRSQMTFPQQLLRDPLKTFQTFPDLAGLCVSVVILGFFLKVWRDSLRARLLPGGAEDPGQRWDYRIDSTIFLITLVCLLLVSGMRLSVSLGTGGQGDSVFGRSVSAFLGLTLPLLAAAFFTKGYDALANFFKAMRASVRARFARWAYQYVERRRRPLEAEVEQARAEVEWVSSSDYFAQVFFRTHQGFDSTYREAVKGVIERAAAGRPTQVLMPIAATRQIAGVVELGK